MPIHTLKGVERGSALVGMPTAVDVSRGGTRLRRGAKVRTVATGLAKLELFNHLRLPARVDARPYSPGYVHLPKVDAEFLKQLLAAQLLEELGVIDAATPGASGRRPRAQRGTRLLRLRSGNGSHPDLRPR